MSISSKTYKLPQFRSTLIVLFGSGMSIKDMYVTYSKRNKFFRDNVGPWGHDEGETAALTACGDRTLYLFFNDKSVLSDVHHECIHLMAYLFDLTDTKFTEETEETFAYTSTMFFEQVVTYLNKKHGMFSNMFLK